MSRAPIDVALAADSPETVETGLLIARAGGNAVDVAVAAGLTATVSEILMCSLGGSAFVMIRTGNGPAEVIDGADAMPGHGRPLGPRAAPWREVHLPYGDGITVMAGHASVAVPGVLAALELAWRRHGSLPWAELVAPAIDVARSGFPLGPTTARWLDISGELLFAHQAASRACFFPDGRAPARAGERFIIPDMAETLEAIAREGARAFYAGDIAAAIAREIEDHGGFVSRRDLAAYEALVRAPLRFRSGGFELDLNPPPAVGGTAVAVLIGMLEAGWRPDASAAERALLHARVQAHLLGAREHDLAPPDFDDERARALLEPGGLARRLAAALGSPHTTHLSIATGAGDLVGITMSNGYGAGVTIPGTGITCNNGLGEPELNPLGYFGTPSGTRLVSNMAPTIAWHPDGRGLVLGSPGASRITTAVVQTWARHALEELPLDEAVRAPRLHVEQWHDGLRVQCEPGIDASRLEPHFLVRPFADLDMFFGAVQAASIDGAGRLSAVADVRRHGAVGTSK